MLARTSLQLATSLALALGTFSLLSPVWALDAALTEKLNDYQQKIESRSLSEAQLTELAGLTQKFPGEAKVHLVYGLALDLVGLNDQALEQFQAADKLGPQDSNAVVGIIHHLVSKGDKQAARALLDQALKRFPEDANVLFMLGKTLKQDRDFDSAEKTLWRAHNLPNRPIGLATELAELYSATNPELAVNLASEDIERQSNYAPALAVLAEAFYNQGQYRRAIYPCEILVKQSISWRNISDIYARCLFWDGRYKEAVLPMLVTLAKSATYLGGRMPGAEMIAQTVPHISAKKLSDILDSFYASNSKELVRNPFHFYLASALEKGGRYELAYKEINTFLSADPKNVDALIFKGKLQETYLGDYDGALQSYKTAHALLPYNGPCNQALMRLEDRLRERDGDLAWKLRDGLRSFFHLPPI